MSAEPLSLLEFVHELLTDAGLRGAFADDPRATLHAYGLGALSPADVRDALVLAQDNEITDFRTPAASWSDAGHGDITGDTTGFGHGGSAPAPAEEPWWAHDGDVGEHLDDVGGGDFGGGHIPDEGWHLS